MGNNEDDINDGLKRLDGAVKASVNKLAKLKAENKGLKDEVSELRRLLAINEKKTQRLKDELQKMTSADEKSWQVRERTIKQRLKRLATKLSAFEQSYILES
ncbi:MAG: hypothetical protein DRP26_02515 [Candidatus Zixiibacteriota bacterium]|nr:MAG: hypothetical protein DRP26_02515 [candidate division Zixibacteria bacterium]